MAKQRNIQSIHNKGAFFADAVAIIHSPIKFILDFKQASPRIDQVGNDTQETIIIDHEVITLDPKTVKVFSNLLTENIKNYEKQFGEIKLPKKKKQEATKKKDNSYNYIG